MMAQESLLEAQMAHHAEEITRLSQALNQITINLAILTEKQTTLIEKLDSFFSSGWPTADERLKKLETYVLTTQERHSLLRSLYKGWPLILSVVLMGFLIGVIKADDIKQAHQLFQVLPFN